MAAKWNLFDWMQELESLCMTYWATTIGEFEETELRRLWNTCVSPQDAFQSLAKKYDLPVELPEPAEMEFAID